MQEDDNNDDDEMPRIIKEQQMTADSNQFMIEYEGPMMQARCGSAILVALTFACDALIACAKQLDLMDKECGDGNYGSALARSAGAVRIAIKENRISTRPCVAFMQISRIVERELAGLDGGVYSLFFDAVAKSFLESQSNKRLTADMWLIALTSANRTISEISGTLLGNRSMLDALLSAEHRLRYALESSLNPVDAFGEAVDAAETSAMRTVNKPRLIRGSTNHETFEYPDPGAHAVGIWMRASYEGVKLKCSQHNA